MSHWFIFHLVKVEITSSSSTTFLSSCIIFGSCSSYLGWFYNNVSWYANNCFFYSQYGLQQIQKCSVYWLPLTLTLDFTTSVTSKGVEIIDRLGGGKLIWPNNNESASNEEWATHAIKAHEWEEQKQSIPKF